MAINIRRKRPMKKLDENEKVKAEEEERKTMAENRRRGSKRYREVKKYLQ